MKLISATALLACTAIAAPFAQAQGHAAKPVPLVVPFPAGGATDSLARVPS